MYTWRQKRFTNICKSANNYLEIFYQRGILHGVQFLGQKLLHIFEKIIWMSIILLSFYFCITLSLDSWHRYQYANTVVTIEKDYYYWNLTLPSMTICPMNRINESLFDMYCLTNNIVDPDKGELFQFLDSLANSSYSNFNTIKVFPSIDKYNIKPKDYIHLIFNLTLDITLINPEDERFKLKTVGSLGYILTVQILTEYGICYTTNNYISRDLSVRKLLYNEDLDVYADPFYRDKNVYPVGFSNMFDEQNTYSFLGFPHDRSVIYLHSATDTLKVGKQFVISRQITEVQAAVIEVLASDDFRQSTAIHQRKCRFNSESNLTHFKVYSKELCHQECRINLAMKLCKCIPHFYSNAILKPKPVCSYHQLKECFPQHISVFTELRNSDGTLIECFCEPNCVDTKIIVEDVRMLPGIDSLVGGFGALLVLRSFSRIRFVRKVLFSFTDFLVSIGGTAGLLLGFSVLGIVEIFYFFTLRLFWHISGRR